MTWEQRTEAFKRTLDLYKQTVDKGNFAVSDRKKMLALPFYLSKRQELPEPKKGQFEY